MRFGLLGPLTVRDGAAERRVGGHKLRTVLAVLLLEAGRSVSTDTLGTALWGDRPPASAKASLQNMVSRLRVLLDDSGGVRLRSMPGGYLLHVTTEELDALLFERRLRQAQEALRGSDWPSLHRETTAALALWRGVPLAELPDLEPAQASREQWQESRLQALEWRIRAEVELGQTHGLVPELTRLVTEHPLREAFHGQLMLALDRLGQRAEALAVYQRLRRSLVEELGIEPGTGVRQVHQQILRGGTATPPTTPPTSRTAPRPAQLRSAPAYFVGRDSDLRTLVEALTRRGRESRDATPLGVISGMAGVGKTALALRVAESVRKEFPDGQFFVNLRGATPGLPPLPPLQAITMLLTDLGVGAARIPEETDAAAALLRSRLADTRSLLVLDDVASAAHVQPLLPAGDGCAALITSRSALATLDTAAHVRLTPLTTAESLALLRRASHRPSAEIDTAAGTQLVELCGRLPLALRIATARLSARTALPLEHLVAQLTSRSDRLDHLELDNLSMRQSLAVAYDSLKASERRTDRDSADALRRLGALDVPEYSVPLLAQLMDVDHHRADTALNRLAEVALVDEIRLGRYAPHDLVRDFAHELTVREDTAADRAAAVDRALRWYTDGTCATALVLSPQDYRHRRLPDGPHGLPLATAEDAIDWADQELPNLVAVIRRGSEGSGDERVLPLLRALFPYLHRTGHCHELRTLNEAALDVARAHGDLFAEANVLSDLAAAHYEAGRWERALSVLDQAVTGWTRLGDTARHLRALGNRSILLGHLSRGAEAIATLEEGLALSRKSHDSIAEALMLSHLGNEHEKSDPRRAIDLHRRSIDMGADSGNPVFRSSGLCNIGFAHLRLDEPEQALTHFEAVLALPADELHWNAERESLLGRIRALRGLGRLDETERRCQELLADPRADDYCQGLTRHQYGLMLESRGDRAGALACWQQATTDLAEVSTPVRGELDLLLAGIAPS